MMERASAALPGDSSSGWAPEPPESQHASVTDLVPALKRSFWIVAGCVLAIVLPAMVYVALTPPSYVASAQLLIGPAKQSFLLQDSGVVDLTIDNAQVESQVEVLGSERIADDVISTLRLEQDADFRSDAANSDYARHRIALARFKGGLSTRRIGQSYVIEVAFRSNDPEKAARIANGITAAYIRDQLEAKTDVARQASQWMQERVTELGVELNAAATAVQKFRAANGISDNGTNNQPRLIDKLTELEARAQAYRKLYESFLQKLTENQQQESYPVSNARVITAASTPLVKTYPRAKLILLFSILLGLVAGAAIATARSILDGSVRNGKQIRQGLALECLAALPSYHSARQNGAAARYDEVLDAPFSPFAEAMRSIKVSVQNARHGKPGLCLGVVSLLPGEGKTTLAVNLASLFATSGSKTLLIDANFGDPSLSRELAPGARHGLVEALHDGHEAAIAFDPTRMVYILPLVDRERLANSADLLSSPAMKNLLSQLTAVFATVIVDLPALSRTVDARAVAPMLDQCILVTKWGGTPLERLKEAVDLLRADQIRLLGAVINRAEDGIPPLFGWRLADVKALDQAGYIDRVIQGVSR